MSQQSYLCVSCRSSIALQDVNVSTDIALCRNCGKTMSFSEVINICGTNEIDPSKPPKGVLIEDSPIHGRSLIYRKVPAFLLFIIPFTVFWSGFSMFGIYGTQIKDGKFDLMRSLFGLPFLFGTIILLSVIFFGLFGRWRIGFSGGLVSVALQVGPIGWTRRILCDRSANVGIKAAKWYKNNVPQKVIEVDCLGKKMRFGSSLSDDAKVFVAEMLRRMIQGV
jgi:hypothetical protein